VYKEGRDDLEVHGVATPEKAVRIQTFKQHGCIIPILCGLS
jgi:hypothetical protein